MSTAVLSDLHLGKAAGHDLLSRPGIRERLFERIGGADRLVLLGDVVELRESPILDALRRARPFFEELGQAFAGKPVLLLCGNHDYQLARPLFEARAIDGGAGTLGLADTAVPPATGPLGQIAAWARPAELELGYPGTFIRPDVYATHGHYMDWHGTVPTIERLAIGLAERVVGHHRNPGQMAPADYEAALAPVYELAYTLAQSSRNGHQLAGGGRSVDMWERLNGTAGTRRARIESRAANAALPVAVAALNRLGLGGPLRPDVSAIELRRAGLRSIAAVVAALGVEARHVIFGHTHRSGPWEGDVEGWDLPSGGGLFNTGSWLHEPAFLGADPIASPYFPGVIAWVDDDGPPRIERLLEADDLPERS